MSATNIQWILDELSRLADESVKRYKVERYNIISTNRTLRKTSGS
jgi:hypothetical protein